MKFFLEPKDYPFANPRLDGFKKLQEAGAPIFDIFVTSPKVAELFLKNKKLPEAFWKELALVTAKLRKKWPGYAFAVRRAYVVPGVENPPGPRFNAAGSKKEIEEAFSGIFTFGVSQKYDQVPGSQIAAFIHPWIGPAKFDRKKSGQSFVSYGGYAISQNTSLNTIEIYAVYGMNEGVQTLVADRYLVSLQGQRSLIARKDVPQKNKMFCPTEESQAELIDVPLELQLEQVLFDNEILEVARVVESISKKHGPQRVEFMVNEAGTFFIEAANYWKEILSENGTFEADGTVITVAVPADLKKLEETKAADLAMGKKIVFVDETVVAQRNYDVLGALAAWGNGLVVLYPGVAATQHAMRILADKGHRAFLVGTQRFNEGDKVKIVATGEKTRVTNLSRSENQEIISLWDASLFDVGLCGGKANRLSKLKVGGFQVPHGSVITTIVFDELLRMLRIDFPVSTAFFAALYERLKTPPAPWLDKISKLVSDYKATKNFFAVRSSATIEDSATHSMAGLFESYLNVPGNKIAEKVAEVFRSTFCPPVSDYLMRHPDLLENLKMAVIVEQMIDAKSAGVIFGADIRTRDANVVEIEASYGLGHKIVSGEAKKLEHIKFSRSDRKLLDRTGLEILSPTERNVLLMLSEKLKREFNDVPQDIEWAIDKSGQLWVLQSRDLIY